MIIKNDLFDYSDRYIFQDTNYFKFSLDSILLAEYIQSNVCEGLMLDMCAGNMAVPLILSKYNDSEIVGFEIQESIYNLGKMSIDYNMLTDKLTIINDDIKNISNYYNMETFDVIFANPPFFEINCAHQNTSNELKIARHEVKVTLEELFSIASKYLKGKGKFFLVHRADRLDEIINYGFKYKLFVKDVQLISTKNNIKPRIALVKCTKNSKKGIKFRHEMCVENVKTYQNIFKEEE